MEDAVTFLRSTNKLLCIRPLQDRIYTVGFPDPSFLPHDLVALISTRDFVRVAYQSYAGEIQLWYDRKDDNSKRDISNSESPMFVDRPRGVIAPEYGGDSTGAVKGIKGVHL